MALTKDSNLSEEKRFFLMDKLGFVAIVDMIPDLIDLYSTLDDTNYTHLKNQIIPTTQNIYQRYLMLNKYSAERDLLSKFYLKILGDKLKQTEKAIAIRGFISLNYNDNILHHLNKIVSKIDETDNKLPAETIIKLKLELASLLPKFEVKFISEIVNLLQNENKAQLDSVLNTFIVARLSQLGIGSISYESKNIVSSYLHAIKFKYINRNILINDDGISMFSYGSWLEASALVNSDSLTEAGAYIAKHIEQASPIEQKNYIIGLSSSDYIKKAFRTEPVLIKFKKNNEKIYSQSIGYRSK